MAERADQDEASSRARGAFDAAGPNSSPRPGLTAGLPGQGILTTLAQDVGIVPRILLREIQDEAGAPVEPPPAGPSDQRRDGDRYQLLGEIARGGMGAVIKGRDLDLGRVLAVKILLEAHRDNPDVVRRFVEEAQIGGQLQHPGIVPVYELGQFADRRPYFTMKLVQGQTLAALLKARTEPAQDLPRYLTIFEQVCQTVAYAHARGVIHRDLKPLNVMVGAFGEVQVMDWGLAKVLATGPGPGADRTAAEGSAIQTVRAGSSDADTEAGSLLGTPSYMAPEQARGDVEDIDERADVFGLGSILCEVLTGRPPYVGRTRLEIRRRAARAELDDALARLEGSGADAELVALARACLAIEPPDRPRDAAAVADAVSSYRAGVAERLRRAELARVEEHARAEHERQSRLLTEAKVAQERRARRLTVALAATVLALVALGGGGWAWVHQQRAAREAQTAREVHAALDEATVLWGRAKAAPVGALLPWNEALAAAKRAAALLARGEGDAPIRQRVQAVLIPLIREHDAAKAKAEATERDRAFLLRLEEIRGRVGDVVDRERANVDFAAAFREAGIDVDALSPDEAGARIAARTGAVELTAALDEWTFLRRVIEPPDLAGARRLVAVARRADPDPWRNDLRAALVANDTTALRRLAAADPIRQPVETVRRLAYALDDLGHDTATASTLLRAVQGRHPDDFWVNFDLARCLVRMRPPRIDESIRFFTAAVALRPGSGPALALLGNTLSTAGRHEEAVATLREATRLAPDYFWSHRYLSIALGRNGRYAEAIAAHEEAIRLRPSSSTAYNDLGITLRNAGRLDEAIAAHKEAIRLQPDYGFAYHNLGVVLGMKGQLDEAIAAYKESIRLQPDYALAHSNLGLALRRRGEFAAALDECRRGHELASQDPNRRVLSAQWVLLCERSIALDQRLPAVLRGEDQPADAAEGVEFARLCHYKGLYAAATRSWEAAFALRPELADDLKAGNRYDAACSAALAGSRPGRDDPPPDEAARARLRQRALAWLRANLAIWAKSLANNTPSTRQEALAKLRHWPADPDLAGLRDEAAVARLPEPEREACRALWAEIGALLAKLEAQGQP